MITISALSNYLETALINVALRATAYAAPATVYLALYSTAQTDADGGTEISGGAYARQAVAFVAPTDGVTTNSGTVTFPAATAGYTATHFGIRDAASGGNLLFHGALAASKTVAVGDQIVFQPGDVSVTLS